jgi:hypothetical protein
MQCAPVLLFVYKRLDTLQSTVEALRQNKLSIESELYIFSDAAKEKEDQPHIKNVRSYIDKIDGFKRIEIYYAEKNKGLAKSIIEGVSTIINKHGKAIVLEDDLMTSKNFLVFMNKALEHYENNKQILSIGGYTPLIKHPKDDVYFIKRASSWGWATWKDRWETIDWSINDYHQTINNSSFRKKFNEMGSDMYKLLNDQMKGKINSWAILLCYHQFLKQQFTVFPTISKVKNIGMGGDSTHTRHVAQRFKTVLDESENENFIFLDIPVLDTFYLKQFLKIININQRVKYKLLNLLRK